MTKVRRAVGLSFRVTLPYSSAIRNLVSSSQSGYMLGFRLLRHYSTGLKTLCGAPVSGAEKLEDCKGAWKAEYEDEETSFRLLKRRE